MDYYASAPVQTGVEEMENEQQQQQKSMQDHFALAATADWPPRLVNANVWPSFLWRRHAQHLAVAINTSSGVPLAEQCLPIQASFPELVDLLPVQLLFSFLYLLIWMAAILGNASVLYVVTLKQVKLSSVRSVFICSLAASDILMSMTSLPITAVSIFTRDWVFPSPFCKLMGIFQGGTVFVSSFTLTAIAVDRYILIKHPTKQKIKFRTAVSIVAGVWLLGYACALPVGMFSSTVEYYPFCGLFCEENWPDIDALSGRSRLRKFYGLLVLIVQFGLPMLISSLCYWQIGRLIRLQMRRRSERQEVILQESKDRMRSQKNKTNRMMATMVAGLVLAWLPMNLINLWRDFNSDNSVGGNDDGAVGTGGGGAIVDDQQQQKIGAAWFSLIFAACHSIAMTSAVWNPIIYSFFNPQFKDTIRMALERRRQSQATAALMTNHAQQQHQNGGGGGAGGFDEFGRRASSCSRTLITTLTSAAFGATSSARNSIFLSPARAGKRVTLLEHHNGNEKDGVPTTTIPGEML